MTPFLSTPHRRFTCVRLPESHLPRSRRDVTGRGTAFFPPTLDLGINRRTPEFSACVIR